MVGTCHSNNCFIKSIDQQKVITLKLANSFFSKLGRLGLTNRIGLSDTKSDYKINADTNYNEENQFPITVKRRL